MSESTGCDGMVCQQGRLDQKTSLLMMMLLAMAMLSSAISPCDLHLQGVD